MSLIFERIDTPLGELLIAATEAGICRISFPAGLSGHWFPWFDHHFGAVPRLGNHSLLDLLKSQLEEYWPGIRRSFDLPLDLRGPEFHLRVWRRLQEIPYGTVVTYGEMARELGIPYGPRAIGNANANNPIPIVIPCHRVVGSGGRLVGFAGGLELKERLLEIEGARIPFRDC